MQSRTGPQGLAKSAEKELRIQWDKDLGPQSVPGVACAETYQVSNCQSDIRVLTAKLKLLCQNLCRKKLDSNLVLNKQSEITWLTLLPFCMSFSEEIRANSFLSVLF